ncbi:hypothetical protein AB7M74_006229 [Bradyrhizobium japonicum]
MRQAAASLDRHIHNSHKVRDMYLFRVKSPEQSKYKFDYYELLATIPGEEAFRPMEQGGCPLLKQP